MKYDKIEKLLIERLQEAAKVFNMDASHSSLHTNLQKQIATDHRNANPEGDYYGYPYVQDVYGDGSTGTVVYSKGGQHTMANYKADGQGFKLSGHTPVKKAYVAQKTDTKESAILVDGNLETLSEADADFESTVEPVNLREATFDANGNGMVKLIAPGHGSTGYYSPEVLKEAVKKGVFDNAQMFIDHATDAEEQARPEGSVRGLAAKAGKAQYMEAHAEGPGVYAPANAYPDSREFLNQRSKDIGVSIRAAGRAIQGQVGGRINKIVKSIDVLKSADFVTRAGAGGKLLPLLESFRESSKTPDIQRQQAAQQGEQMALVQIEESELSSLRESAKQIPGLVNRNARYEERFNRMDAVEEANTQLTESKLPKPAQARLLKMVQSQHFDIPLKDGVLDKAALKESIKALVADETAYLKESGIGTPVVRNFGDGTAPTPTDEEKAFIESQKADTVELDSLVGSLTGIPRKEKK